MNAIANVLVHAVPEKKTDGSLVTIAIFCGVGLLASLCMVTYGFDLSGGFF